MIFLRPTIVRDSTVADTYTGERYDYILGEQEKAQPAHDAILPDMKSPTLPPRPAPATRPAPPPGNDVNTARAPVMNRGASRIPYVFAKANGVVVTSMDDSVAEVAVRNDAPAGALAELRRTLGVPVRARRIGPEQFDELIAATYNGAEAGAAALAGDLAQDLDLSRLLQEIPKIEDLLESQDDAPVIRLINALFTQALRDGASDIHIEPFETRSVVRLRIDGTLRDLIEPARALHGAIVSRIKIMAQLDIAEKRLPQDGRITLRVAGKPVDVRVSTIPTGHGERVVLRLLDKQAGRLDLTRLGMDDTTLAHMDRLILEPHGIVLVTGPTGSGKTTTLYAALSRLDATTLNIMTVEDPIEYDLDGISQTQVNTRIEMSFARALRTILRQDPDVVMIGEIRDLETAADRGSGESHRPSGIRHAAHQRRSERGHAACRHGRGAFPARFQPDRSGGTAPGAPALPGMPQAVRRRRGTAACPRPRTDRWDSLYRTRLRRLQSHGLSRPHRHLRIADGRRRPAPADPRPRVRADTARARGVPRHALPARRRHALGRAGRDQPRRSGARDARVAGGRIKVVC